jgi:hypothetical protein
MNGQAVFQEELNGAFNRRFVAQPFRVEIQLNTVAQFRDRFAWYISGCFSHCITA